jgi:hypothetical protein
MSSSNDSKGLELFRKVNHLGLFSLHGEVIGTPAEVVENLKHIFVPKIQDMIENEATEFVEGFLAGLLYGGKFMQYGADRSVATGDVPVEKTAEVRAVQVDVVLTLLAEYLLEQRQRD